MSWRLILIYILAIWLFAYGFMILSYLLDSDLAELIRHSSNLREELAKKKYTNASLTNLAILSRFGYLFGFFFAFMLMLFTGRRKPKFYWVHATVALVTFMVLSLSDLTGWNFLKLLFLAPGQVAGGIWFYIINGTIMIAIGMSLLSVSKSVTPPSVGKVEAKAAFR